ncbi:MAG TPA: M48 family metalloprotease [Verrucomicrobiae bacterium]
MITIILITAFLLAAGATFATNWLALIPWRRSRDKHWTEQARLVYPVFTAARINLFAVPGVLMLGILLSWPNSLFFWGFAGFASFLGANLGNLFLTREVFPRASWPDLLSQMAFGFLMNSSTVALLVIGIVAMPSDLDDLPGYFLAILFILGVIGWIRRGSSWLAKMVGLFQPAPQQLVEIARQTAARMSISYRNILLMRSPRSGAFAYPGRGLVIFTSRLLEVLNDEEIGAICAHELAHLSESRGARFRRSIAIMAVFPWIFLNPLYARFGPCALVALGIITIVVFRISISVSRKLEVRADSLAKASEGNAGTYARALVRLYQDNLLPAVIAKKHRHPDLYDRLLAAGVTPDFPRPSPARPVAWHGRFFAGLAGLIVAVIIVRQISPFHPFN